MQKAFDPVFESWKHLIQRFVPEMLTNRFAKDLTKIGGQGQIATFVKL